MDVGPIRLISGTDQLRNNSFASYLSQSRQQTWVYCVHGVDVVGTRTSVRYTHRRNILFGTRKRKTTFVLPYIRYHKGNSPARGGSTQRTPVSPISCREALSPSGESDAHQRRYVVVLPQGSYPTRRRLSGLRCRVV